MLVTHVGHLDMPVQTRAQMTAVLNRQLADTSDPYNRAKQAHWNVKEPLFDQLADALEQYVELPAQRVTTLRWDAMGTVRRVAAASRLQRGAEPIGLMV
jgi:starvation-inducible DNA-binding protein